MEGIHVLLPLTPMGSLSLSLDLSFPTWRISVIASIQLPSYRGMWGRGLGADKAKL